MSEIKFVRHTTISKNPYPKTLCAVSNAPVMAPAIPDVAISWPVNQSPGVFVRGRSAAAAVYLKGGWDRPYEAVRRKYL